MSIFKKKGSPFYYYDFQLNGARLQGSTRTASRREAEIVEREKKAEAKAELARHEARESAMTLGYATKRYFDEVGSHNAAPETTLTNLERLERYFGTDKRLAEITDNDVAKLVVWRRSQPAKGRKGSAVISPATVNRSTIEPLQKLFNRAERVWNAVLPHKPRWNRHLLKEPEERVREVRESEEAALHEAIPPDYRAIVAFARVSGLRQKNCILPKSAVDLVGGTITVIGKGGKQIRKPITAAMREILVQEMQNPTDHVFTYRAARARKGHGGYAQETRRPITESGLKTVWRRSKAARGLPADLRFHDLRHDFATKLLRKTGNLKLVQKALNHSKIETTTRYAHVLDEEVREGMEMLPSPFKKASTGTSTEDK